MNTRSRWTLTATALLLGAGLFLVPDNSFSAAPKRDPLTRVDFDVVKKLVPPQASEDEFDKIPWLTSIWAAREKAAKEGKPILLWEMDGHPLGCG